MSSYPKRGKYFAHRFIRLLTKTAAAQDLGAAVCWLLAVIAMQEDSKRYTEPAKWYLEQLAPLCGMSSKQSLITAINKAKEAGWLEYTPGGKGVPGRFWVTIPPTFEELPDFACDESIPNIGTETVCSPNIIPQVERNLTGSLPEAYRKPCASIPTPFPKPNPKETDATIAASLSGCEKPKAKKFDPKAIAIPLALQVDSFKRAWIDWCDHRCEIKHSLKEKQAEKQLEQFEQWGFARSVAAINHTITKGWQGIREPDVAARPSLGQQLTKGQQLAAQVEAMRNGLSDDSTQWRRQPTKGEQFAAELEAMKAGLS